MQTLPIDDDAHTLSRLTQIIVEHVVGHQDIVKDFNVNVVIALEILVCSIGTRDIFV